MIDSDALFEELLQALVHHDFKKIRTHFKSMESADISELLEQVDIVQSIVFFRLVPKKSRSDVFSFLTSERQMEMIERLPDQVVISLLNDLDAVDRTKLLEELPSELSGKLLQMLSPEERAIATKLLSYPEDSVGRMMNPEFVCLRSSLTVAQALDEIRWNGSQYSENLLSKIFVVDEEGQYLGFLHLAALILTDPPSKAVEEVTIRNYSSLSVLDSETDAVDFFRKYDEPYIPVLGEDGQLLGTVEPDDIFDVAEEEATEDIQQFGGQDALEDSYFQTSMRELIQKRAGWLAVLFVGMMFTANAMEHYDWTIAKYQYLMFFVPMIMSSGGNSGSQAASLMIRGLAVKEVAPRDWFKVFSREVWIGLALGLILGILGYIRVMIGGKDYMVGAIVSLSIVSVVLFGALIGSMLPFLLKLIRLDPAVSSSPVIASLVDIIAIVTYFQIAIAFLEG